MKSTIGLSVAVLSLIAIHSEAKKFTVEGIPTCDIKNAAPFVKITLKERDVLKDDIMGSKVITTNEDRTFTILFDETEFGGVEPYLYIEHDCNPKYWVNGYKKKDKLYCYTEQTQMIKPGDDAIHKPDVLLKSDKEICDEKKYLAVFSTRPKSEPETTTAATTTRQPTTTTTTTAAPSTPVPTPTIAAVPAITATPTTTRPTTATPTTTSAATPAPTPTIAAAPAITATPTTAAPTTTSTATPAPATPARAAADTTITTTRHPSTSRKHPKTTQASTTTTKAYTYDPEFTSPVSNPIDGAAKYPSNYPGNPDPEPPASTTKGSTASPTTPRAELPSAQGTTAAANSTGTPAVQPVNAATTPQSFPTTTAERRQHFGVR